VSSPAESVSARARVYSWPPGPQAVIVRCPLAWMHHVTTSILQYNNIVFYDIAWVPLSTRETCVRIGRCTCDRRVRTISPEQPVSIFIPKRDGHTHCTRRCEKIRIYHAQLFPIKKSCARQTNGASLVHRNIIWSISDFVCSYGGGPLPPLPSRTHGVSSRK